MLWTWRPVRTGQGILGAISIVATTAVIFLLVWITSVFITCGLVLQAAVRWTLATVATP